jgi:hypothetical protein
MQSWRGNCNIENLLSRLPNNEGHINNYDKLCLFTHFSSFTRRSETKIFPMFSSDNEQRLVGTVKYALDAYFLLRNDNFFDKKSVEKLDDVFSLIAPVLLPKIAPHLAKKIVKR